MTNKDVQNIINGLVANSQPFILGEYRGNKKDTVNYTDKKTGQAASFTFFSHNIETNGATTVPMIVRENLTPQERLLPAADIAKLARPNHKGKQVLIVIASMATDKGTTTLSAKEMHIIEA